MGDVVKYALLMTAAFEIAKKIDQCEKVKEQIKNEKKEPNKQRPLSGDKWLAYDDEPADAPDYDGIGSGE